MIAFSDELVVLVGPMGLTSRKKTAAAKKRAPKQKRGKKRAVGSDSD